MSRILGIFFQEIKERGLHFANSVCCVWLVREYALEMTKCEGPSMYPTFNVKGDRVLLEKLTPVHGKLTKGDVVICKSPLDPKILLCKRLVAQEGENVTVVSSNDGRKVHVKVPKGHVWIEGDNSKYSSDSRHYGPVPRALICGKVIYKVWPPSEIGPILNSPRR